MKIAIVDDSSRDRDNLAGLIVSYLYNKKIQAELCRFDSGENFLADFAKGKFAIIFLDIFMAGMDGMKVARLIREQDTVSLLIFVTNCDAFALEGYWVRAFHYLVKPYSQTDFEAVMDRCCEVLSIDRKYITVKEGRLLKKLFLKDIRYAEMQGHYVLLHTPKGNVKSRMYFQEIELQLKDSRFLKCYRNVIVNMDHVETMEGLDFILKSGDRVPIQKQMLSKVKQAFTDYIFYKNRRKG